MPDRMSECMAGRTLEESFFYSSSVGYGMLSHGSVWKWAPHTDVAPARFGVHRSALSLACGALTFERDVILRGRCGTLSDSYSILWQKYTFDKLVQTWLA